MKKGQIVEGVVQRVDFTNKGIVETEDGVCVVKNALPGQRVQCAVNKVRHGKAEGRLLQVLEPSPLECGSPCPHFGICGGCTYLSFPYEEQLKIKEAQVKKLLDTVLCKQIELEKEVLAKELCKPKAAENQLSEMSQYKLGNARTHTYRFEGIKASPISFGYRNKMEFSFGDEVKDGPLSLGMHKRGSFYDIVSVTDCRIVDEDYRKILKCVLDYFDKLRKQGVDIPFYHRLRHVGYLRHLLVRKASKTGEILVALVTTTQFPGSQHAASESADGSTENDWTVGRISLSEDEVLTGLRQELLSLPLDGEIVGILHTRNDSLADVVQSDETILLYGQDFFYEELLGLKFKISQFSFFQTNSRGAEVLYETAREYILNYIKPSTQNGMSETEAHAAIGQDGQQITLKSNKSEVRPDKVVYDLYSGTGTIAQLMAPVAKKVIGVEIVEEAVEAAQKNAELNGLHNCEFIAGDVLKVIGEIEEKPDIIILDPPRDGIHPKALDKIIRYGVEHILYISCKPTSLARDLEVFLARGYQVERAVAVDQFPWTANVETVCLLSKLNVEHHIEVELNLDEMDLTAAESKATYEEIKAYVKEQTGLQVSNLYIAQVKRKCGIIERVNYNLHKATRRMECLQSDSTTAVNPEKNVEQFSQGLLKSEDSRQPKCPSEKEEAIKAALKYFKMI